MEGKKKMERFERQSERWTTRCLALGPTLNPSLKDTSLCQRDVRPMQKTLQCMMVLTNVHTDLYYFDVL